RPISEALGRRSGSDITTTRPARSMGILAVGSIGLAGKGGLAAGLAAAISFWAARSPGEHPPIDEQRAIATASADVETENNCRSIPFIRFPRCMEFAKPSFDCSPPGGPISGESYRFWGPSMHARCHPGGL